MTDGGGAPFELRPRGPFSLAAAADFLGGFTPVMGTSHADQPSQPASGAGPKAARAVRLSLSFRLDKTFAAAGAVLEQRGDVVLGHAVGTPDVAAVKNQTARILGLDVDATGYPALGEQDPVVGKLQAQWPGFRAVSFSSPYEAAVWGLLAQRISMKQAAALKSKLAVAHGDPLVVGGHTLHVVPSPGQLMAVTSFPGLPDEKLQRLRGIARAALDGVLDADRLRAMPPDFALTQLEQLKGVGVWTAQHILLRGCGTVDALPTVEPRVLRGVALAYGLGATPTAAEYERIAEAWRPFRMWVAILVVRLLAGTPEWNGPEPRGKPPRQRR